MQPSYVVRNNSVWQPFTALNAQLVTSHNWTETCFLSPQICWLRKIRSVESFGCQWNKWTAWFCCLV